MYHWYRLYSKYITPAHFISIGGSPMFTQDEMETILYVLEDHAQDNANEYMVRKINAICDKMNEVIVPMPIEGFVDEDEVDCNTFKDNSYSYRQMEHDSEGC